MYRKNDKRPNIVFINVDQMRWDCLSCAGHPAVETPYLDSLKFEGVQFVKYYSSVPSCIAARAAMLTGMSQRKHGRVGYKDGVDWNYEHTMPGELSKAGYQTIGVGKMHFHPARSLMGFDELVLHDGYLHFSRNTKKNPFRNDDYLCWLKDNLGMDADYTDAGMNCNAWTVNPWPYEEKYHPTNWVVTQSIDFLRRRDERKPFFLWMSFVRPHAPLDPPQHYLDHYMSKDLPEPVIGDWAEDLAESKSLYYDMSKGKLDKGILKRSRAAYYALISHIDCQVGRFFTAMHDYNVSTNTVIVFTSDHGELIGDHNLFRKALPFKGSARVPFLIKFPESFKIDPDRQIAALSELRDLMPTVLDIAGVKIPKTVDGKSLLPLIKGRKRSIRSYLHGEHAFGASSNHFIVNENNYKYIWYSQTGRELFFDLNTDPDELKDLSKALEYKKETARCRKLLIAELKGREEGYTNGKKLIKGREPKAVLKFPGRK